MTDERSTGKIIGVYHHLIIQQLKKHTEEKNVADFASFVLRHAIIPLDKDASLPENKRTGLVNYQRDPTRMVTHYYLQSLLMGVKKSFALGFLLRNNKFLQFHFIFQLNGILQRFIRFIISEELSAVYKK